MTGGTSDRGRRPRVLSIISTKGGVGRSTFAANLLIAARLDGVDAVGLDLHQGQHSMARWSERRARRSRGAAVRVATSPFRAWREALDAQRGADLIVVDLARGFDWDLGVPGGLAHLARASDLVLTPTPPGGLCPQSVVQGVASVVQAGTPAVMVLNRIRRRHPYLPVIRAYLRAHGELCPIEMPESEAMGLSLGRGISVVESVRFEGAEEMAALWRFAADRLGLARTSDVWPADERDDAFTRFRPHDA